MIDYIELEKLKNKLELNLKEINDLIEAAKNDPAPEIPKELQKIEGKTFIKQGDKEIFASEIEDYTKVDFYHGKNLKFGELVPEVKNPIDRNGYIEETLPDPSLYPNYNIGLKDPINGYKIIEEQTDIYNKAKEDKNNPWAGAQSGT